MISNYFSASFVFEQELCWLLWIICQLYVLIWFQSTNLLHWLYPTFFSMYFCLSATRNTCLSHFQI